MQKKPTSSAKTAKPRGRAKAELVEFGDSQMRGPLMSDLYRRALAEQHKQKKNQKSKAIAAESEAGPQQLLHELQVHQIELQMQNAELQHARDELELTLEKYTDLYDFAPVGYFTLAPDGIIHLVNLTGAHLVGIERSRLVGLSFGLLISTEFRPSFNAFLKRVFANPARQAGDFEILIKGRPSRIVNIEAQRSSNGHGCRVAAMDITGRKQAEDKVRVSEIRYRRLFEAAHDGVLILDPGTRKITDANPFMTKLLGYSHRQLVGKELFEIGLLKDEAASQEMFQKLKRQHEVRYEDLPLESEGGRHQEVEVVANLYQEDDRPVIQCNIRDITVRKRAEIALNRLAAIVEFSEDAMVGKTPEGIITSWNHGAEKIFGYTAREIVGTSIMRLIPAARKNEEKQILAKLNRGESVQHFETLRQTKDGRLINVSITASPIKDAAGRVIGVSKVARDITARKQAEATQFRVGVLAASNQKLESEIAWRLAKEKALRQSERHKSQLLEQSRIMQEQLRNLSRQVLHAQEEERKRISRELHDVIAQTLTGINIRLATLKNEAGRSPKDFDRIITRTQRLVEKSVSLVHDFARELRPTVLDDLGLIPALHAFMKNFTAQTGVRTHLTAFAGVEKLAMPGRTALFRIAQEALTNVARHAQASRVEVGIQKLAAGICMKIKDDGKSFQVEHVLNAGGRTRLGLLGMKERLEMVGGSFHVESVPGKGTTVIAEIPFAQGRPGGNGKLPPAANLRSRAVDEASVGKVR